MKEKAGEKAFYRATYYDYLLAAVIVILFAAPLFSFFKSTAAPVKAVVYKDNVEIKQLVLAQDAVVQVGGMRIEVKGGKVHVLSTDCKNQICAHEGWISEPGQSLVCLPNKVVVDIPADRKSGKYDVVSY